MNVHEQDERLTRRTLALSLAGFCFPADIELDRTAFLREVVGRLQDEIATREYRGFGG